MSGLRIQTQDRDIEFGVTEIPNRKSKCLYKMRGANLEVMAYFRNDDCADEFSRLIDDLREILITHQQVR